MTTRNPDQLAKRLLTWYQEHRRDLPWRRLSDPYAVWISEVMLQQTRVETVIPYFQTWMQRFPGVESLAKASQDDVLNAWEGLGYYSRARNLHKTAKILHDQYGGKLPRDAQALRSLPGIGRYTAGAIASIAFGLDEPVMDGNLRRVFARLFDLDEPADTSAGEVRLWALAADHLPPGKAGDYNQALMDLGATLCAPTNPHCERCPVMDLCLAYRHGTQAQRPVLKPKREIPRYVHAAGVILRGGRVMLSNRPPRGLLGGMWEFPNGRVVGDPARELDSALDAGYRLRVRNPEPLGVVQHAYTHFRVQVHAFRCTLVKSSGGKELQWVPLGDLEGYPMGKVDRQIARMLHE